MNLFKNVIMKINELFPFPLEEHFTLYKPLKLPASFGEVGRNFIIEYKFDNNILINVNLKSYTTTIEKLSCENATTFICRGVSIIANDIISFYANLNNFYRSINQILTLREKKILE